MVDEQLHYFTTHFTTLTTRFTTTELVEQQPLACVVDEQLQLKASYTSSY